MSEEKPEYLQALEQRRRESLIMSRLATIFEANNDTVSVPKIFIDICKDMEAAMVLDEIFFWTLPKKKTGQTSLRVKKDGVLWLAVRRQDWANRKRLSERQADRAIEKLIELGFIEKDLFKFNGKPTVHLRIKMENFIRPYTQKLAELASEEDEHDESFQKDLEDLYEMMGMSPNGNMEIPISPNGDSLLPNGNDISPNGEMINSPIQPSHIPASKEKDSKTPKLMESTKLAIFASGDMGFGIAANLSNQELADMNAKLQYAKNATDTFERELAFNPLPWDSNEKWKRFKRFVVSEFNKDPACFRYFASKRRNEGQFTRLPANPKIYSDPDLLIAIWPSLKTQPETTKGEHLL